MKTNTVLQIGIVLNEILDELKEINSKIHDEEEIPLNTQQAAVYLGVSSTTIANYVKRGLIQKKFSRGLEGFLKKDLNLI